MPATLRRTNDDGTCTLGTLTYGDREWLTLELPWKENRTGISCIPTGTYHAVRDFHKGEYEVWELTDVPGRSQIQIHIANTPSQLRGCVALGITRGELHGEPAVLRSRAAFAQFMEATAGLTALTLDVV
jgi:hypothetical protein